jgi:hypothetical protein
MAVRLGDGQRAATCRCSRAGADVARSSVPVAHPVPGRDDAQSHRDASFDVRMATHCGLKSLSENPLTAIVEDTTEPASAHGQNNSQSLRWKIGQCSTIAAVDAGGQGPADRAGRSRAERPCTDPQFIRLGFNAFNSEPARSKRDSTTHKGDSLPFRHSRSGQIASALSQSQYSTPIDSEIRRVFQRQRQMQVGVVIRRVAAVVDLKVLPNGS